MQRRARVETRADQPGQPTARLEGRWGCQIAVPPNEIGAVAGETRGLAGLPLHDQIAKRDPLRELVAPAIADEDRLAIVQNSDNVRCAGFAAGSQHPLEIRRDRQATRSAGAVLERQSGDFHGVSRRHEHRQLQMDAVRVVAERRVALTVPHGVRASVISQRQRRRAEQFEGVFVADVDQLAGRVADRIVRPRRQFALAAVERPRVAAARLRNREADVGIGDHVDPRRGRALTVGKLNHVLETVLRKTAEAVEILEIGRGERGWSGRQAPRQ